MKLTRIKVRHSRNCCAKGKRNEWSGLLDKKEPYYYGNRAGNKRQHGNYHVWYNVVCNDPHCKGVKIVHSSILAER